MPVFRNPGSAVAAAEEERFLGIKFANGQLPRNAIAFCLAQAGLAVEDLDAVSFGLVMTVLGGGGETTQRRRDHLRLL